MKATVAIILRTFILLSVFVAPVLAQAPHSQQEQPEFIKQGQQLMREGKLDAALALYRRTLQTSQDSLPANIAAGSVLDLMGQGEEGRQYLGQRRQSKLPTRPNTRRWHNGRWLCRTPLREIARRLSRRNSRSSTTTGV